MESGTVVWIMCLLTYLAMMGASVLAIAVVLFDTSPGASGRGRHWLKLCYAGVLYLSGPQILTAAAEPVDEPLRRMYADCISVVSEDLIEPRSYHHQCKTGCSLTKWTCLAVL